MAERFVVIDLRRAPATGTFARPAGGQVANTVREDVAYAFVRGRSLGDLERLLGRLYTAPTAH